MDSDKVGIPTDVMNEIISHLDIKGAFKVAMSSTKSADLVNHPQVLNMLSDANGLPHVNSIQELMTISTMESSEFEQWLVERGLNKHLKHRKDMDLNSLLFWSVMYDQWHIFDLLVSMGADYFGGAFIAAASINDFEGVEYVYAEFKLSDSDVNNALLIAKANGHHKLAGYIRRFQLGEWDAMYE